MTDPNGPACRYFMDKVRGIDGVVFVKVNCPMITVGIPANDQRAEYEVYGLESEIFRCFPGANLDVTVEIIFPGEEENEMSQVGQAHKRMMLQMKACDRYLRLARVCAEDGGLDLKVSLDRAIAVMEQALDLAKRIDSGTEFDP